MNLSLITFDNRTIQGVKPERREMKDNVKESGYVRPRGKSERERWYAFARKWCSVIENRQKNNARCKHCFTMKEYPNRLGHIKAPYLGCDGCAEMDKFFDECKKFFKEAK